MDRRVQTICLWAGVAALARSIRGGSAITASGALYLPLAAFFTWMMIVSVYTLRGIRGEPGLAAERPRQALAR
jgi:hypothetical protein